MIVIAHNIRSLHNVGAIFRNCAAFGVEKLFLTGFTAAPPRKEIAKTALGAQDLVMWETGEIGEIIGKLKADGYSVYGLEQGEDSIPLDEFASRLATSARGETHIALVLGNEVEGIDPETRSILDGLVEIPMEKKKSLNVSVASGIALYALKEGSVSRHF